MKEKLSAVLLACAALALFWALLFPKPPPPGDEIARPLSFETRPDGYAALSRWLQAAGIGVVPLRRRFEQLEDGRFTKARTGNLLVTTLPEASPIRDRERAALERWVAAGNTLLLVAALDDTPKWGRSARGDLQRRLAALAHVNIAVVPSGAKTLVESLRPPAAPRLVPEGHHPSMAGVAAIVTHGELEASEWRVTAPDASPIVVLARRGDTHRPAVWLRAFGDGAIVLSAWASPFSNARIGEGDNAQWVASLAAWSLGEQGVVILDDMHQGATDYYDAERFFSDPRLHHTLWWIVGLWFAWVLGARPLLAARPARAPLDDTSMLRVTGGFLAHVLRPADAARRLFAVFFNDLRRRLGLPENGEPLWDWLAGHSRVDGERLAQLRGLHARAAEGRRVDLIRLQNSLLDLTGRLS